MSQPQVETEKQFSEAEMCLSKLWIDMTHTLVLSTGVGGIFAVLSKIFSESADARKQLEQDPKTMLELAEKCKQLSYQYENV